MSVHLTQLITESVKVSIRAHKLCHDGLKCHSTHRRQRSGGGWSGRSWRSYHLCLGLPRSKLCRALFNGSSVYGTHHGKMRRLEIGDGKVKNECHHHVKEPWTFCKPRARGILTVTPRRRCLKKTRREFDFGHYPQTLIAKVVRMCYPRNV